MEQIKSKYNVRDYGEVFTSKREVNAMLDLVKQETERIDSRFLEPACGTGNFLVEVLKRKMEIIFKRYRTSQTECEKYLVVGIGSLYGIDLLEENVLKCRERLFKLFKRRYETSCKVHTTYDFEKVIQYILSKNIVCGDALTMLNLNGCPIIFPEWSLVTGCNIKRRDFSFSELVKIDKKRPSIFDAGWTSKEKKVKLVPNPVREYSTVHYKELIISEQIRES